MTFKENITEFFNHKQTVFDYFVTSASMIAITQMLEGVFKIIGYILTSILLIRALVGLRKDYIESKTKKIEQKIKEFELKKLEDERNSEPKRKILEKLPT